MKKILFIDLDGTIMDCEKFQISRLKSVMENHNVNTRCINFVELIGPPLSLTFEKYIKDASPKEVLNEYNNSFDKNKMDGVHLYEGMSELLEYAKQLDYKICLVSLQIKSVVEAQLKYFKIDKFFDYVFCDSLQTTYKSKSDLVKDSVALHNFKTDEIVFVGDTYNDVMAGKKNNITSIAVEWGYGNVSKDEADYVAKDAMQLQDLLLKLKNGA